MDNRSFIKEFINGKHELKAYGHLGYTENTLYNYHTAICTIDREKKTAQVNVRKYSSTTSRIQSALICALNTAGYNITEYQGEPCSYWNGGYVGARTLTKDDMRAKR